MRRQFDHSAPFAGVPVINNYFSNCTFNETSATGNRGGFEKPEQRKSEIYDHIGRLSLALISLMVTMIGFFTAMIGFFNATIEFRKLDLNSGDVKIEGKHSPLRQERDTEVFEEKKGQSNQIDQPNNTEINPRDDEPLFSPPAADEHLQSPTQPNPRLAPPEHLKDFALKSYATLDNRFGFPDFDYNSTFFSDLQEDHFMLAC